MSEHIIFCTTFMAKKDADDLIKLEKHNKGKFFTCNKIKHWKDDSVMLAGSMGSTHCYPQTDLELWVSKANAYVEVIAMIKGSAEQYKFTGGN